MDGGEGMGGGGSTGNPSNTKGGLHQMRPQAIPVPRKVSRR